MTHPALRLAARPVCSWQPDLGYFCVHWPRKGRRGLHLMNDDDETFIFETIEGALTYGREYLRGRT